MSFTLAEYKTALGNNDCPVGTLIAFAGRMLDNGRLEPNLETALEEEGWWLADGRLMAKADAPKLWKVMGRTYGPSANAAKFRLPDLRGVFARGFDASRGQDRGPRNAKQKQPAATGRPEKLSARVTSLRGTLKVKAITFRQSGGANNERDWAVHNDGNGIALPEVSMEVSGSNVEVDGFDKETRPVNVGVFYLIRYK